MFRCICRAMPCRTHAYIIVFMFVSDIAIFVLKRDVKLQVFFSLSIEACAAFSTPCNIVPQFPFLTVSTPAFWCRCFLSRNFHPCIFDCAVVSCLSFSVDPMLVLSI